MLPRVAIVIPSILLACSSATVRQVGDQTYEARCKDSTADCLASASERCKRGFRELDRDFYSPYHSGLEDDSKTDSWYALRFTCTDSVSEPRRPEPFATPQATELRSAALERVESDYIAPSCEQRTIASLTVRQCGLQVREAVWSKPSLARFFTRICRLSAREIENDVPQQCIDLLLRKWHALLAERYYMMDISSVRARCDAHPEDCENLDAFEAWCLESHNRQVLERYQQKRAQFEAVARSERKAAREELERKQAAEEEESRAAARAFADALSQLGARMQGKPVFRCSEDGSTCWAQ